MTTPQPNSEEFKAYHQIQQILKDQFNLDDFPKLNVTKSSGLTVVSILIPASA